MNSQRITIDTEILQLQDSLAIQPLSLFVQNSDNISVSALNSFKKIDKGLLMVQSIL